MNLDVLADPRALAATGIMILAAATVQFLFLDGTNPLPPLAAGAAYLLGRVLFG